MTDDYPFSYRLSPDATPRRGIGWSLLFALLLLLGSLSSQAQTRLFWVQSSTTAADDRLSAANLDGTSRADVASGNSASTFINPMAVAVDATNDVIYVGDAANSAGGSTGISRFRLSTGAYIDNIIPGSTTANINAIQVVGNRIYWVQSSATAADDRLSSANLDGTSRQDLAVGTSANTFANPQSLYVDVATSTIYVGDGTGSSTTGISRFALSGGAGTTIVTSPATTSINGIQVVGNRIYWVQSSGTAADDRLSSANLDGTSRADLASGNSSTTFINPQSLYVDAATSTIYVGDGTGTGTTGISRFALSGGAGTNIVAGNSAIAFNGLATNRPQAVAPTVTQLAPTSGPVGTSVIITGTGFAQGATVKFNGTAATTVTVNSTTQITASVPTGATTGNVVVTTSGGSSPAAAANVFTVTVPTTVTSIVRASTDPTNATTVQYTVTFAASVTGLTTGNFNLTTTGTFTTAPSVSSVSGSGITYTVTVNTGSGNGTLRLNLNTAAGLTPSVSNVPYTSGEVYIIDKTAPTTTITSSTPGVSNGSTTNTTPISFTVTFSESVLNFISGDVQVTGGTISGFSGAGSTYTFNVTPTTSGTVRLNVAANVANDQAGNGNTAATEFSVTYQQPLVVSSQPVTVQLAANGTATLNASSVNNGSSGPGTLTYTIQKIVYGRVTENNTLTLSTPNGVNFTQIRFASYGTPTNDANGNYRLGDCNAALSVTAAQNAYVGRNTGSLVASNGDTFGGDPCSGTPKALAVQAAYSANAASLTYDCTEASKTQYVLLTVTSSDGQTNTSVARVTVNAPPTATISNVNPTTAQSGATVTVTGTNLSGVNTVTVNGATATVSGLSANGFTFVVPTGATIGTGTLTVTAPCAQTLTSSFTVQAPALTATVSTTSASPTSTSPIPFAVSFSQSVGTSFTASDVTVSGGTLTSGSFSGSGSGPYTFTVTPSGTGTVSVSLAANVAQDANNTGNTASNTVSVQFQAPTITVSPNSLPNGTQGTAYSVTFTSSGGTAPYSYSITAGALPAGMSLSSGGTLSGTPAANGSFTFTVTARDNSAAPGPYTGARTYTLTITPTPTVTVTSVTRLTPSPSATATVSYRVTFSGSVSGLTVSNFNLTTSGLNSAAVSSVSGSGSTYTVMVNTGTGDGTLRLNVNNSTGTSPTISNVPYTSGEQYSITKTFAAAPTLRIQGIGSASGNSDVTAFVDAVQVLQNGTSTVVAGGVQNGSFETNNVQASSYLYQSQGVVASPWIFGPQAGISRNNSAFGSTAADGDAVVFLQSAAGNDGNVSQNLAVPTGSYQIRFQALQRNYTSKDQQLNVFVNDVFVGSIQPNNGVPPTYGSFTSAIFSVVAPALTATVSTTSASPTSTSPVPFAASFSQSVGTSFTAADVTVSGGTLTSGSFSGSGAGPYTFTVTPSGAGTVSVSLAANVAQDANNTGNTASNTVSVQFQVRTAAPVVTTPANNSSVATNQPTYSGIAPANSTVTVYVDGSSRGTTTADASGSWTLTQPTALATGSHTVYATAQANGEAVSNPSNTNTFTVLSSATYVSSTAEQPNTGLVQVGSTNQEILRVGVVIGGGTSAPLSTTSLSFTTNGSTRPADIAAARVYYTGTNGTLTTTTPFGSAVASPNGTFTVTGNQLLTTGTNYFFLVYDVAATATPSGVLDATLTSLTVGGTVRTPTATDPTGNRRIVQTSRVAGTALRFVGGTTPGYVNFSTSTTAAPVLGPEYTQVAWIKPSIGTGSETYYVLGNGTGTTAAPYIAITGNGRVEAGFGSGTNLRSAQTGPQTITTGVWNQVAATFDGSRLTVYLNGEFLVSLNASDVPASTPVNFVGSTGTTGTNFFPGDIDEVSQWNRALSQTELRLLRHLVLTGAEDGLISYLQFNDKSATTTLDGISGAVGTLTGVSRVTSTAPVGAGTSNLQSVTATGNYPFTGTNVAINFTSVQRTPYDVVVTRLEGTPLGTPVTDPNLRSTHTRAYWIVDKYSTSNFAATITYTLDQGLISTGDAAAPANLKLYKRGSNSDGAFDAPIPATAANAVASTVTFPVTSFSQTFIGTYGSSPLPVELVRFTAERKGQDALLRWATAQERNNAYFEVESSVDGRTFQAVGRVMGQGTSAQAREYSLSDKNLARYNRSVVYYRLRQVDTDGTTAYSGVQTVQVPRVATDLTVSVFPNPTAGQLTIRLSDAYTGKAQGGLFDAQGRLVQELNHQLATATSLDIPVSVQHLPTGVYTLRLILNGQVLHQQVVVQH